MNQIFKEFVTFSRQNWWIYILITIALGVVWYTGKGNMIEIIGLFLANILWNLFIMAMQDNYTAKNNKIWAIYHVIATLVFAALGFYGLIYLDQSQYILWQISYSFAALKAITFYNFDKEIKILNEYSFIGLNLVIFAVFIQYFEYQNFSILQAVWFSLITTWLVSVKDSVRYWLNVLGITALTSGSAWWTFLSFQQGEPDGIALGFFILTLTVLVYYIKLLKKYL